MLGAPAHSFEMPQNRSIKDFFKPPSKAPAPTSRSTRSNATSSRVAASSTSATGGKVTPSEATLMSRKHVFPPATTQSHARQPQQPSNILSAPSSPHTIHAFPDEIAIARHSSSDIVTVNSEQQESVPAPPAITTKAVASLERVIKGSDDEDSDLDSDDELPDFLAQLQSKGTAAMARSTAQTRPRTPSRATSAHKLLSCHSPLTVQSKKLFDFKALAQEAKIDDATEASSKRLKALLSASNNPQDAHAMVQDDASLDVIMEKGELLDLLTEDLDEEEAHKRKEVLKRSQGGTAEKRWYFFGTKPRRPRSNRASSSPSSRFATLVSENWIFDCVCGAYGKIDDGSHSIACDDCNRWQHSKCVGANEMDSGEPEFRFLCQVCTAQKTSPERAAFPLAAITEEWNSGLSIPEVRRHTLISGMAENMVTLGRTLPDELLSWMRDELCFEKDALLREAYTGILLKSPRQVHHLINEEVVQDLFRKLGGTATSASLAHKIVPVQELATPYPNHDWANLKSIIKLFGHLSEALSLQTRQYIISMLLRLASDTILLTNLDLIRTAQDAMIALCQSASETEWEACCPQICSSVFTCIEHVNIRLQVIKCIPLMTHRTRDIKRRLAAACFFEDNSYCEKDTYIHNDINRYTNHLRNALEFKIGKTTDFHDVAARISLLDIAVDDGQHAGLDLSDDQVLELHNEDIAFLGRRIRAIYQAVPTDISATLDRRIEAKIAMEVVAYRMQSLTINRLKPRKLHLDGKEDFGRERNGMSLFLKKKQNLLGVGTLIGNANI